MAHKKAGGSSKNGRDSNSKRLGVKAIWWRVCEARRNHYSSAWH